MLSETLLYLKFHHLFDFSVFQKTRRRDITRSVWRANSAVTSKHETLLTSTISRALFEIKTDTKRMSKNFITIFLDNIISLYHNKCFRKMLTSSFNFSRARLGDDLILSRTFSEKKTFRSRATVNYTNISKNKQLKPTCSSLSFPFDSCFGKL